MEPESDNPPLIVIVGETASGKSALAMATAQRFDGEIIAADSWTVYRDFDIGTAKPSEKEQEKVRHHLLNIADPAVGFSAVEFQQQAVKVIAEIASRGKLPILVGGTGLYIDSVIFNYSFLPAPTPETREHLNSLSLDSLLLLARQNELDLSGIDVRNKRRIIRLIENGGARPERQKLRDHTLIIGVKMDKESLRERVTQRIDAMLAAGLEQEVHRLSQKYEWQTEPMKGIGYREFEAYFNGEQNMSQTRERIISATMNLAKRQRTWFKRNKSIHWISKQEEFVELITTFLNKSLPPSA